MQAMQLSFDKLVDLHAIDVKMRVDVSGRYYSNGYTEKARADARIKIIEDGTDELGYYYIDAFENGVFQGREESYYVNGFAYYDDGSKQYVEEVDFSEVEDFDTDINSILDMDELNKLKPKVKFDGSEKYTITLTDVPLNKIIKDTQGLQFGNGDYVMNVWVDKYNGILKKFDYKATFDIEREVTNWFGHRNTEKIKFEMKMAFEVIGINARVHFEIPNSVMSRIDTYKSNIVHVEDDEYRYTLNKNDNKLTVRDKETLTVVYSETYHFAFKASQINMVDGTATVTSINGDTFKYFVHSGSFIKCNVMDDNHLYFLDKLLFRLTVYDRNIAKVIYSTSFSSSNRPLQMSVADGIVTVVLEDGQSYYYHKIGGGFSQYDAIDDKHVFVLNKSMHELFIYDKLTLEQVYYEKYPIYNTRMAGLSIVDGNVVVDIERGRLNEYLFLNGSFVIYTEDDEYLYTIDRSTAEFVVYSKSNMEVVYTDTFEAVPYVIDVADGIVAIGFGHGAYDYAYARDHLGKRFVYYDVDGWVKNTITTSNQVDHIFVYDGKIYYANQDQHNELYVCDTSSGTSKRVSSQWSLFGFSASNATYYINREEGILYVGSRMTSNNRLSYICLETDAAIYQSDFSTLGGYTQTRVTFDGDFVYYANRKFDKSTGAII